MSKTYINPVTEIDLERVHDLSTLFDLVAYQDFDENFGYWNTRDRDFVTFLRLGGVDKTLLTTEVMESVAGAIGRSFASLPGNTSVSFFKFVHRDISPMLNAFSEDQQDDPLCKTILDSVIDHQIKGCRSANGFFDELQSAKAKQSLELNERERSKAKVFHKSSHALPTGGRHAHMIDLIVTVRFTPESIENGLSLKEKLKVVLGSESLDFFNSRIYFDARDQFISIVYDFIRSLHTSGFRSALLSADGIIDVLYRYLNPEQYYKGFVPKYNCKISLGQMLGVEPIQPAQSVAAHVGASQIDFVPKGMNISHPKGDTFYYRAASVGVIPRFPEPDQLQTWLRDIEGESLTVINFHVNTDFQRNWKINRNKIAVYYKKRVAQTLMQDVEKYDKWVDDLRLYEEMTDSSNKEHMQRGIDMNIHYIPYGRDEAEVEARALNASYAFNQNGRYESHRGNTVTYSSIPGRFKANQMKYISRSNGTTTAVLGDLLPIFVHSQGLESPGMLMNNRAGNPIFLDLYGAPKTPHSLIAGGTGTGKSFAFNQMLSQMQAKSRPKTWSIDRGGSSRSTANLWDGAYLDITSEPEEGEERTVLNPFIVYQNEAGEYRFPNSDERNAIAGTLKLMVQMIEPERRFSAIESNMLDEAIRKYTVEIKAVDQEGTLGDFIVNVLANEEIQDAKGSVLASELAAYYGNGKYASIFDGKSTFSWDADLIVLETGRIPTQILPLVMVLLFSNIDSYAKVKLPRSRRKLMAIDEAWAALAHETLINIIAGFFREMRKYNMGILLISQTITEFVKLATTGNGSADTDGIMANVANFFLLPVSKLDYESAKNDLGFSDEEIRAWQSLEGNPPFYSEVFYRFKDKRDKYNSQIFRIYASAVLLWAATTNAVDVEIRDNLIKTFMAEGLSKVEATAKAVTHLADSMPYGSELSVKTAA